MSRYADLERPPLSATSLNRSLPAPWREVRLLTTTPSTNAVAAEAALAGEAEGLVVVAEHQSAGKGRLGRVWEQPERAGLAVSVLLRPPGTSADWGWLTLGAGLAVCAALDEVGGVRAALKWPNDVLLPGGKVAGLLAEAVGGGLVIGIGLNCTTRADELPPGGTSLALSEAETSDRAVVLRALLRSLGGMVGVWRDDRDSLREAYRQRCATLGSQVSVQLPGGGTYEGVASDVDATGCLLVGDRVFASGDVVHLR